MGCQSEIVEEIVDKGADYVMRAQRQSRHFARRDQELFGLGGADQVCGNQLRLL